MNREEKIVNSGYDDDIRIIHWGDSKQIVKSISFVLIAGSILNIIGDYVLFESKLISALFLSVPLFLLGCFLLIMLRLNVKDRTKKLFLIYILTILIPLITLKFAKIAGVSVWAFPFLFMIVSLVFMDRLMLICVSVSALLTQMVLWFWVPALTIPVDSADYVVRIGLFVIGIVIAFQINELYQKKLRENAYYNQKIRELAYHDHLTGLPNRLLFNDRLNQSILLAKRTERIIGVMYLDLDNFKMVNDTIGHEQGDALLKLVAQRLTDTLRACDTVSRVGGDEFLILADNIADINAITKITKRIMDLFTEPFDIKGQKFYISTSVGIAVYPTDGEDVDTLIKNADMAMYKAKEKGNNQFIFCSEQMKTQIIETLKLTNALYRAQERNELVLYYQPMICSNSNKIVGLEALIRWNHPELGLILPDKFIPIAEKTGLINSIGEWVLRTACLQNKKWQDLGLPCLRIGVNLSVYQFQTAGIVEKVEEILRDTDLHPGCLEIEITESIAMEDKDHAIGILKSLKNLGVTIAIDDFGTAYSSLDYLKELPVDRIKIAMTFVHGISISAKDEAITKAIIILARNLGLEIVAEGVETDRQLAFFNHKMCDEIQGFYYFRPMPSAEVEKLLLEEMKKGYDTKKD